MTNTLSTNALLTPAQVSKLIPWSKNHLLAERLKGNGPTSFQFSPRKIRYLYSDVLDWLETRRNEPESKV